MDIYMLFRAPEHTNMHNPQSVGGQCFFVFVFFTRTVCKPAVPLLFCLLFTNVVSQYWQITVSLFSRLSLSMKYLFFLEVKVTDIRLSARSLHMLSLIWVVEKKKTAGWWSMRQNKWLNQFLFPLPNVKASFQKSLRMMLYSSLTFRCTQSMCSPAHVELIDLTFFNGEALF